MSDSVVLLEKKEKDVVVRVNEGDYRASPSYRAPNLVKSKYGFLQTEKGISTYRFFLDENPEGTDTGLTRKELEVAQSREFVLKAYRDALNTGHASIADSENPVRISAGGGTFLTRDNYVLGVQKDGGAPTYKFHGVPFCGLSRTHEESRNFSKVMSRELWEECVLTLKEKGKQIVPSDPFLAREAILAGKRANLSFNSENQETLSASWLPIGKDIVEVYDNRGTLLSRSQGIVNWDPDTAGIDLMGVIRLPYTIAELALFDGEGFGRNMFAVHIDDIPSLLEGKEVPVKGDLSALSKIAPTYVSLLEEIINWWRTEKHD